MKITQVLKKIWKRPNRRNSLLNWLKKSFLSKTSDVLMMRFLPWKRILETPVLFKAQNYVALTLTLDIDGKWIDLPTLVVPHTCCPSQHCTSVALVLVRMGGVCLRLWNLLVPWPPSMLHAFHHHQGWMWTIYVDLEERWIPQFWTHKPFIFVLGH